MNTYLSYIVLVPQPKVTCFINVRPPTSMTRFTRGFIVQIFFFSAADTLPATSASILILLPRRTIKIILNSHLAPVPWILLRHILCCKLIQISERGQRTEDDMQLPWKKNNSIMKKKNRTFPKRTRLRFNKSLTSFLNRFTHFATPLMLLLY